MTLQILPRLPVVAKQSFVLLRYFLKYIMSYTEIDAGNGAALFGWPTGAPLELAAGTTGYTSVTEPTTFRETSGAFSPTQIGKYLVTFGSPNIANNGIWKIVLAPDANTLVLQTTLSGPRLVTDTGIKWYIVDPALLPLANDAFTVLQAPSPAGTTPAWQVKFTSQIADVTLFRFEVAPLGGWNATTHLFPFGTPVTTSKSFTQDATPKYYFGADSSSIFGWTENVAGTDVFDTFLAGSGVTFHPGFDPGFAMAIQGLPDLLTTGMLNQFESLDQTNIATGNFTALKVTDTFIAGPPDDADSLLRNLPNSPFDLRRDIVDIPVVSAAAVAPPELRGLIRNFHYCSSLIPYKNFVNGSRTLVSLGKGICVDWNGSLFV